MSIPYEGVPLDEEQEPAEDGSLFETIKTWANSKILGTGLSFAKSTFEGVKTFATEGNLSLRSIGMSAAGALFLVGFLGVFSDLVCLNIFGAAFDILLAILGVVCFAGEYSAGNKQSSFLPGYVGDYVNAELHILSKPYGRSIVYIFMGFIITTTGSWLGFLLGVAIFVAGGYICYNMREAEAALKAMKNRLADENVAELFKKYDIDGNNQLNTEEIALLSKDLGMHLTRAELEAATVVLDRSDKGAISFEEFKQWYTSKL